MTEQIIYTLVIFGAMLFIGPHMMVGWYAITRGRTELKPTGETVRRGKLLMAWHFYWTRTHGHTTVRVEKESLKKIYWLLRENAQWEGRFYVNDSETQIIFMGKKENQLLEMQMELEKISGCSVWPSENAVSFTKQIPEFVFPEWVRDPVSECPTCFASVYGSIFYWIMISLLPPLFNWSEQPTICAVVFWIIFCFCSAYINTVLAKKLL